MPRLEEIVLEPVNTLTHLIGAVGSLIGLIFLIRLTIDFPAKMITLMIYGLCQLSLYTASCLLHGVRTTPKWNYFLNRLDHMAIFLMIAGVYTPILYHFLPDPWRWLFLALVWGLSFTGVGIKLFKYKIHGFLNVSIYLLLSWGVVVPIVLYFDIMTRLSTTGLALLLSGGIVYTIGFCIYYFERPDPWPKVLGHHEIWHIFVLVASFLHFLFILKEVVPA